METPKANAGGVFVFMETMKKFTISLLIILPFVLTACIIKNPFVKENYDAIPDQGTEQTGKLDKAPTPTIADINSDVNGSIFDIVKLGKDITCTYTDTATKLAGTIYVSGQKVRSDFTTTVQGRSLEAHTYMDGEWAYMWSPILTQGTKMNVTDLKSTATATDAETKMAKDKLNQNFVYHCQPWTVDQTMFDLPKDITFTDATGSIKALQQTDKTKGMCSACDYIQEAAKKAECLKALNCQ